ncbi:SAM-dependent methyltransferase [Acrocarpospora macrocephala]
MLTHAIPLDTVGGRKGGVSVSGIDPYVANIARVYDWLLGGKDHFPVGRDAAERIFKRTPDLRTQVRDLLLSRVFLPDQSLLVWRRRIPGAVARAGVPLLSRLPSRPLLLCGFLAVSSRSAKPRGREINGRPDAL